MHPSAISTIEDIQKRFPQTAFLALGQTALWDEPTKATLRLALDQLWSDAPLIAATHDTDYFAKLPNHSAKPEHGSYALVLHDDARTRGLWSAAGEMSQLFGSEDVVTREMLQHDAGVTLHRALSQAEDPLFLLSNLTAAWGWTGIIYTEWDRKVVCDVPLIDILPTLLEQVETAMQGSADCLNGPRAEAARALTEKVKNWVAEYARTDPQASLADLYENLLPRFYELLLQEAPRHLSTSRTTRLLRFNTETARLPRFDFVRLFVNPATRADAVAAYNLAVSGSDIYTLDQFGEGALPFEIAVSGRGRGTIFLPENGSLIVDLPRDPLILRDPNGPVTTLEQMARLLEAEVGKEATLVGKAISLLPMLTAEHVLVFHEGASSYSDRTRDMVVEMKRRGLPINPLRPILRIRYATWDAIQAVEAENDRDALTVPPHLAQGFRRDCVTFDEFSSCWEFAQNRERKRLEELAALRSPRRLLQHLAQVQGNGWEERLAGYDKATYTLMEMWDRSEILQGEMLLLKDEMYRLKREAVVQEREKGDDFRARVQPLRDRLLEAEGSEAVQLEAEIAQLQAERTQAYDEPIAAKRERIRQAQQRIREIKAERQQIERGTTATAARQSLAEIAGRAELEKARLTANSLRVIHSLKHTNYRPSAWWFPLVDPKGHWFGRLAETAEYYLEPLDE
ncbi:MAG: hypothetical protein OHK0029_02910 [Armatimonadaceae bacterium]